MRANSSLIDASICSLTAPSFAQPPAIVVSKIKSGRHVTRCSYLDLA
jgi:hypothetical protein